MPDEPQPPQPAQPQQPPHQIDGGFGIPVAIDRMNDEARFDKAKGAYESEQFSQDFGGAGALLSKGGGSGDSGGYEMDDDSLRRIAKRWYTIADKCRESHQRTRSFAEIQPPGNDAEASGMYASFTSDRGAQYREMLLQQAKYCETEARKCGQALGVYQANEDNAKDMFRKYLGLDASSNKPSSDKHGGWGTGN